MAERRLAEPIGRIEDIEILIERLARRLCHDMETRGLGARNIGLALFRMDGKVLRLAVGTSMPLRDGNNICRLFGEKLSSLHDDFDDGGGFETGRLSALETEPYHIDQSNLLAAENNDDDFSHLIDRLSARLGPSRIICLVPGQTHLPERVDIRQKVSPANGKSQALAIHQEFLQLTRPLRLLSHPEPVEAIASVPEGPPVRFRWRRKLHVVVHVEGPERIAEAWWENRLKAGENPDNRAHQTRDYFRIEDDDGHRYWLYRKGLYGTETNSPRWYMHGIFA
jgi:protein ImuB